MNILEALQQKLPMRRPIPKYTNQNNWVTPEAITYRQILDTSVPSLLPYWWLTEEDLFATDWEVQDQIN